MIRQNQTETSGAVTDQNQTVVPDSDGGPSAWIGTGTPQVPAWIRKTVCSKKTNQEKRKEIEWALQDNADFLHWALLAIYDQQSTEEKRVLKFLERDGRGFTRFDRELFEVADDVHRQGYMTESEMIFCRSTSGPSRVGKYGLQLIALIMAETCRDRLTARLARYLPKTVAPQKEVA
jgi:hypothetical protein